MKIMKSLNSLPNPLVQRIILVLACVVLTGLGWKIKTSADDIYRANTAAATQLLDSRDVMEL